MGNELAGKKVVPAVMRMLKKQIKRFLPESALIAIASSRRYKSEFGVYPNLVNPRTFNEKVIYRMVFDRRSILSRLQDKYAVRDYVRERVGTEILPTLFWVNKDPSDIPFDDLPQRFVVKPTHGSAWFYLVPDKAQVKEQDIVRACNSWLGQNYYDVSREWVYKHIQPRILIEEYVNDGTGSYPVRYKLLVFHGRAVLIEMFSGTREEFKVDFYGRSWNRLAVAYSNVKNTDGPVARPRHLEEMIRYAEILGNGLDFVRVDLYDGVDKVYFGEITTTPGGGIMRFVPDEFDLYLGGLWKLPSYLACSPFLSRLHRQQTTK